MAELPRGKVATKLDTFRISRLPARAEWFHDRDVELGRLLALVDALRAGSPSWLAIIGARKVGKTSLLLELERRAVSTGLAFLTLDTLESAPLSLENLLAWLG